MLPTALPYHTPAKLSRAFFVRRHRTGRQRQNGNPTPRPPQGGSATSEDSSKAARQFVGSQKTAQQGLTTTQGCGIMWVLPRRAARESDRTSKRVSPQGLALFLFAPAGRPMQRPHGACWAVTAKGMGCPLLPSSSPHPTACGPTPSHPARLGPRLPAAAGRPRPLLAGHGGARVGARRRPLSRPPPGRRLGARQP